MAERRFDPRRTVVFDARDVEGPLVVYDVKVGSSTATALMAPDGPQAFLPLLNALRAGLVDLCVNGVPARPDALLDANADIVLFGHTGAPPSSGPAARPPTPPVPTSSSEDEAIPSHWPSVSSTLPFSVPRWQRSRTQGSVSAPSVILASNVADVKLASAAASVEETLVCTIFDPIKQYELAETRACRGSSLFLNHALSKARHLGDHPDGRVLNHVLPGLPRPQVCIHSAVHPNFVVFPVALGEGQFCTLSMDRTASVFELFIHLESLCGIAKSFRHLLARGWIKFAINGVTVDDVFEKDALLLVDSARLLIDPEVNPSLAEERLRPVPAHPSTCEGCLTIHRPAFPPVQVYVSPYATPERIHALLLSLDFMDDQGLALPLDLSPVQFANGAHFLALDANHVQEGKPWYVFDLRRVTHPPFVAFWAVPQPASSSLPSLTELLMDEFPTLDPIISIYTGSLLCDAVPVCTGVQASLATVIGAPQDSLRTGRPPVPAVFRSTEALLHRPGFLSAAYRESRARRRIRTTTTTTSTGPLGAGADSSGVLGGVLASVSSTSAVPASSGLRQVAVFDTVRHVRLPVRTNDALPEVIATVLRSSTHLEPPLAFRVLLNTLPQLPDLQVAVWTEPLHGLKVFPLKVGDGALEVCTINLPLDATPHEAAIHVALQCAGHERLQYHIVHGNHALYVAGRAAAPFVAWQLAMADCGIVQVSSADSSHLVPAVVAPAELICPSQVEEARFAVRSSAVIVHQCGRAPISVQAEPSFGPQHLLERLMEACRLRGSFRMSFPAIMPVSNPCCLHVVLHPKGNPVQHQVPCL